MVKKCHKRNFYNIFDYNLKKNKGQNMKFFLMAMLSSTMLFATQNSYSTHYSWVMNINSTEGRFMAVEKQFRGFDTAMMEVGYRYENIKKAIGGKNYELALYHWQKIKTAIENGYIRRPNRKESSEAFFLHSVYSEFENLLQSKNSAKIEDGFVGIKNHCNACHVNQKVGFIVVE
jgi:hypothetical protein